VEFYAKRDWQAYDELVREPQQQLSLNLTPTQRLERCCELYALAQALRVQTEQSRQAHIDRKMQKYRRRAELIKGYRKLDELIYESTD